MEIHEAAEEYSRLIHEDEFKGTRVFLVVSTFRGVEYIHLRKYYMDFNEEWMPSNEGVAMPLDINNTKELFTGLAEIISLAESREVIEEYFGDLIRNIYPDGD